MSDTFDPRKAVRELALLAPASSGRKLQFARKCGAYAALYNGVSQALVAEEFRLSRASVSNLAGCRDDPRTETVISVGEFSETFPNPSLTQRRNPGRKPRYQDVAAEFDRLGADRFLAVYFTRELHAALIGRVKTPTGADPNASRYAGVLYRPETREHFNIVWREDCWQFVWCNENGEAKGVWSGMEKKQFKTSDEAHHYLMQKNNE